MTRPWFLAAPPALVLIAFPSLALYVGALGTLAVIAALFFTLVAERRTSRGLREELERREREEHATRPAPVVDMPVPLLSVVPPVSDDDWFARLYDEEGNPRG